MEAVRKIFNHAISVTSPNVAPGGMVMPQSLHNYYFDTLNLQNCTLAFTVLFSNYCKLKFGNLSDSAFLSKHYTVVIQMKQRILVHEQMKINNKC